MLDRETDSGGGMGPSGAKGKERYNASLVWPQYDLTELARNVMMLSQLARNVEMLFPHDRVIGRENELGRVIEALSRPVAHSVLLVGEHGVGKATIANGVAHRIAQGDVPESLRSRRIVEMETLMLFLDRFQDLDRGVIDRGEFQERFEGVLEEIRRAIGTIVFIDDLGIIDRVAGPECMVDFIVLLKSALARGEIQFIAATSHHDYRKFYERYNALDRLQTIVVEAPRSADLLEILMRERGRYERVHRVPITDDALEAAIELAERFLTGRGLLARAIGLIEASAAHVGFADDKIETPELKALNDHIEQLWQEDLDAIGDGDSDRALKLYRERNKLEEQKENIIREMRERAGTINVVVDDEVVAEVVSITTGARLSVVRNWLRPRP